tara:strand:+ start:456 stop:818 length:363 start_codon:yes stop_codon:yes gene_type:complete
MQKFNFLFVSFFLLFNSAVAISGEINPFTPQIKEPTFNNKINEYVDPLKKWEVFQYDLIGVVLSKEKRLALLETPDGEIYTVTVGSKIGSKDNKIIDILIDRLVLKNYERGVLNLKNHKL